MLAREHRVVASQTIRYVHYCYPSGGVVTVATIRDPQNPSISHFGFSWCSPKDNFRKATGRETSRLNLLNGLSSSVIDQYAIGCGEVIGLSGNTIYYAVFRHSEPQRPYDRVELVLQYLASERKRSIPSWSRKTQQYWMHGEKTYNV